MACKWTTLLNILMSVFVIAVHGGKLTPELIKDFIKTYTVFTLEVKDFNWCEKMSGQKKKFKAIKDYIEEHRPRGYEDYYHVLKKTQQNILIAKDPDNIDDKYSEFDMRNIRQVKEADERLTEFVDLMGEATENLGVLSDYVNNKLYFTFCTTYSREKLTYNHEFYYPVDLFLKYGYYIVAGAYANCLVEVITKEAVERLCFEKRVMNFFAREMHKTEKKMEVPKSMVNITRSANEIEIEEPKLEGKPKKAIVAVYAMMVVFVVLVVAIGFVVRKKLKGRVKEEWDKEAKKEKQAKAIAKDDYSDSD